MAITLGANRYGKSGIRLVTVSRDGPRHRLDDLTVDVWLEGDYGAAHRHGDNANVLPTDTMRGTVYAFAKEHGVVSPEQFGLRLAEHFVADVEPVRAAEVTLAANPWQRINATHDHAFTVGPAGARTARIRVDGDGTTVCAGLDGIVLLKTTRSGFEGFLTDEYTTLPETDDRILATAMVAEWRYRDVDLDWDKSADQARRLLTETFAGHDSASLQHTLYVMGEALLADRPEIAEVWMSMPNRHHILVDLSPYGLANENEVFVATDRPYGVIEGTVTRES